MFLFLFSNFTKKIIFNLILFLFFQNVLLIFHNYFLGNSGSESTIYFAMAFQGCHYVTYGATSDEDIDIYYSYSNPYPYWLDSDVQNFR